MPIVLAIKKAPLSVPNALSLRISAIVSQDIDPVTKHIYPQSIMPNATRKDPAMLAIVPIHANIIIPCRDRC